MSTLEGNARTEKLAQIREAAKAVRALESMVEQAWESGDFGWADDGAIVPMAGRREVRVR